MLAQLFDVPGHVEACELHVPQVFIKTGDNLSLATEDRKWPLSAIVGLRLDEPTVLFGTGDTLRRVGQAVVRRKSRWRISGSSRNVCRLCYLSVAAANTESIFRKSTLPAPQLATAKFSSKRI